MPAPPKSPRRPSLASIFRIGTKSSQNQSSSGTVTDSNASYANGNSSSSCLEDERGFADAEEDWDQIDAASDLDGLHAPTTIRGAGLVGTAKPQVLEKKMKKRMLLGSGAPPSSAAPSVPESGKRGPYLQQDPYAYRSTSGLGRRIVSAGAAPQSANASSTSVNQASNANASQTSLVASGSMRGGKDGPVVGDGTGSVRQTKLSDVQENEAGEAATRASASLSRQTAQAFVNPKGPSASPHTSRSVSASSKLTSNMSGSVRSMPPQPFSPNSISSASGITSPYTGVNSGGSTGGYPDIKVIFTPENIKPLLENAKEVQKALKECVEEMRRLVKREEARLGGVSTGIASQAALDQPLSS
ncbi:hypothetical protein NMY22_g11934 [Coprinellus aureogranulatus]|nr:hypothetical protein NMY22_g11934 [Coprinellus aureogranulatus]